MASGYYIGQCRLKDEQYFKILEIGEIPTSSKMGK